jgi:hypothetical protein
MDRRVLGFVAAVLLLGAPGCSVYMAASAPPKRNTDLVQLGVPRQQLLSEFGAPTQSRTNDDGFLEDTWTFRQGDSTGWKVSRALFHGAADVFTIGMWEVVGTPTEMLLKEDETTFTVIYDKDDRAVYIAAAGGDMRQGIVGEKPARAAAVATEKVAEVSAEARLTDLKALYEGGHLTKKEYDDRRAAIVSGL